MADKFGEEANETMLCLAIMSRSYEIIKVLLEKGSDPRRTQLDGYKVRPLQTCLEKYASGERLQKIESLLQSYGVAPLTAEQKRTLNFSLVKKSAEYGWVWAQCDLAALYLNGTGVEQSKIEAYFWYRVCDEAGSSNKIKEQVDRVRQDLTKAQIEEVERRVDERLKAAAAK